MAERIEPPYKGEKSSGLIRNGSLFDFPVFSVHNHLVYIKVVGKAHRQIHIVDDC